MDVGYPIGLTLITLAVAGFELAKRFLEGSAGILFTMAPPSIQDSDDDMTSTLANDVKDVMHRLRRRLFIAVLVIMALSKAADLLDVVDLLVDLWNGLKNLVS